MNVRLAPMVLAVACSAAGSSLQAQGVADPTRPPAVLETPQGASAPVPSGLQTIIRRQGARPAAVIHGQYVELGGRVGDARLTHIGDDAVTLQGESGREILWLTPGIEKKPAAAGKSREKARKQ